MNTVVDLLNMGAAFMIIIMATLTSGIDVVRAGRDWWVFPKSHTEWEVIQNKIWRTSPALLDSKWKQYYRMPYTTYLELVEELRPWMERQNTRFRAAIPIKKAVAMVLYRLAKGHAPRDVADRFGVGTTTVHEYTHLMCSILADHTKLLRKYITVPSGSRLQRIIAKFKDLTAIDNFAGAIDGSHIKLHRKPANKYYPAEYWSRHDFHSVLLQGVCDSDKLFWDVCVRCPGGTHDAAHLRESDLWGSLRAHEILQEPVINVGGRNITPFIVGDSAYPLSAFMLKAYNNRATGSAEQNMFDKHVRKGRVKIENAFGILKNRFQILRNLNVAVDKAADVIVACCVLHNICILAGQDLGDDIRDPHPNDFEGPAGPPIQSEFASKREGKQRRDLLLAEFVARHPDQLE
jgi:hypothetical protein